jgi:hypothetical protein
MKSSAVSTASDSSEPMPTVFLTRPYVAKLAASVSAI